MKKVTFLVIACFLFSIPNLAICADWTGNLNVFLGSKALDEDEWEPTNEQDEFGIEVDFKKQRWPVSIAIDFLSASGEGTLSNIKFESKTSELNVGIRKIWDRSRHVRPFIVGGIAFIKVSSADLDFLMMIVRPVSGLGEVYTGHWQSTST